MTEIHPYGTWPSALDADALASASPRFGAPLLAGQVMLWTQSISQEKGRMGIFAWHEGMCQSLLPAPYDARSKVHEYGGGALAAAGSDVYFVNAADQQVYAFDWQEGSAPKALTSADNCRFADLKVLPQQGRLLAVCEDHTTAEPRASVVAIDLASGALTTLASGADFYAGLCVSPCQSKAACIQWQHPNMPWDVTELIELDLQSGALRTVIDQNVGAAILQPGYSPDGVLYCVSDKSQWWNLIRANDQQPLFSAEIECATPQWVFGMQNWGFTEPDKIVLSATSDGAWQLYQYDLATEQLDSHIYAPINARFNSYSHLHCHNGQVACIAAGPRHSPRPAIIAGTSPELTSVHIPPSVLGDDDISIPQSLWFATTGGARAHLWYYPPTNSHYKAPEGTLPPLIVLGHGGPTGACDTALNLKVQYWTQRGFAVADVNYRGSTGFGRHYRASLRGQWGIFDVEDLCAAADALVAKGLAHSEQKIIKGSSAGGYSVLAALTQHQTFNAGVSLYGVADLEALAKHTHKFEAHYLDSLIGPYPEALAVYQARSPINNIDGLSCPIFVAQGSDDKVVPPEQAQMIVNAAKAKGVPVHFCLFEGEGHGFRQSETIKQLFAAELAFYRETFALGGEPR